MKLIKTDLLNIQGTIFVLSNEKERKQYTLAYNKKKCIVQNIAISERTKYAIKVFPPK